MLPRPLLLPRKYNHPQLCRYARKAATIHQLIHRERACVSDWWEEVSIDWDESTIQLQLDQHCIEIRADSREVDNDRIPSLS